MNGFGQTTHGSALQRPYQGQERDCHTINCKGEGAVAAVAVEWAFCFAEYRVSACKDKKPLRPQLRRAFLSGRGFLSA